MPFLLFFTRFDNLKIIKIRIPSHPRHIVTVHSEVSAGESIALLVGENVGGDFSQFPDSLFHPGSRRILRKVLPGWWSRAGIRAFFRDGDCRNHIFYIKVIALYQAQLCRLFSNRVSGSQTLPLWSLPKGRNCQYHTYRQVLPSAISLCRSGQTLHRFPPEHSGPAAAAPPDLRYSRNSGDSSTVEAEIARTFCQAGVAVIGLAQGSIAHI